MAGKKCRELSEKTRYCASYGLIQGVYITDGDGPCLPIAHNSAYDVTQFLNVSYGRSLYEKYLGLFLKCFLRSKIKSLNAAREPILLLLITVLHDRGLA